MEPISVRDTAKVPKEIAVNPPQGITPMESPQFKVHPVEDASELIDLLKPNSKIVGSFYKHWGFRGQSRSVWHLVPRAFRDHWEAFLPSRLHSSDAGKGFQQYENELNVFMHFFNLADEIGLDIPGAEKIRGEEFEQLKYTERALPKWPWPALLEALATAQHHGIPTRFLDFTYDGLIAAYFAASDALGNEDLAKEEDTNFSIWAVNLDFIRHDWNNGQNKGLKIIELPLARNPFLCAQKGFFIYDIDASSDYQTEWKMPPPIDEVILGRAREEYVWEMLKEITHIIDGPSIMHRFDVPRSVAKHLLFLLYQHHRISRAHLMPTLDNVTTTLRFLDNVKSLPFLD